VADTARSSPICAGDDAGASGRRHRPTSSDCSRKRPREGRRPRLRYVFGRAPDRRRLGGVRPDRSTQPAHARVDRGAERDDDDPRRHRARHADAIARGGHRRDRRGDLDARTCRSHARHRRSAPALPCAPRADSRLCNAATLAVLNHRFGYVFAGISGYPASASGDRAGARGDDRRYPRAQRRYAARRDRLAGLRFEYGGKSIGYATDFHAITPDMEALFRGLDIWIVDALRHRPHPTHPHLAMILDAIDRLKPTARS
jgi:hypothetical protein